MCSSPPAQLTYRTLGPWQVLDHAVLSVGSDVAPGVNAGLSPTVVTLTLEQGHHYTIDWTADFDFGIHPCSSAETGQSPFELDT